MTRRRSSSARRALAALAVVMATLVAAVSAVAQKTSAAAAAADEAALRSRYGVAAWPTGQARAGVKIDALAVPGLTLRSRTDRLPAQGGISLGYGARATTLRVRVAVGSTLTEGRDALVGFLRGTQADLVHLSDPQGADVALGESPRGAERVAALYGNVAISIERTREAGAETPPASEVLALIRLQSTGAPTLPALTLTLTANGGHITLAGGPFAHVEAGVRGGHLTTKPSPSGLDLVRDGPGPTEVQVLATDSLGRTAGASLTL